MSKYILEFILLTLIFICFYLPYKKGNPKTAIITSVVLFSYFVLCEVKFEAIFLIIFLFPLFLFCIVFITYWLLNFLGLKKIGAFASIGLTIIFVLLSASPWIEDWLFSNKDAKEILLENDIYLSKDFEVISNEKGGMRDYFQTFTLKISDEDYNKIKKDILKKSVGVYNKRTSNQDSPNVFYENKNNFVIDKYKGSSNENEFSHIRIELNKEKKELYYNADE